MKLDLENDFGFTTVEPIDAKAADAKARKIEELTKSLMIANTAINLMYNKIMPLLVNLKKDPTKDIRWTNRETVIDSFIGELKGLLPK